ncbi:hypothetical protein BZG36_00917 [Bifiguratus adelaidae]|uniref:P-loop containing nucleoside triphosphate hydrolase protein n=1 Tax=Bifiguratus adelaidae TaxID=1938954 RepID=A0A261Y5K0_9FUNG|nr:hypothetical protein BZG36_00917 [Bifiguratus adelaidae]
MPKELEDLVEETGFAYSSDGHPPSLESTSSLLDMLTFTWLGHLITLGSKKSLNSEDLPELLPQMRARYLWNRQLQVANQHFRLSIGARLCFDNVRMLVLQLSTAIIFVVMDFLPPLYLNLFLQYLANPAGRSPAMAVTYVVIMFASQIARTLAQSYMFFLGRRIDVNIKSTCNSMLFQKSLRRLDTSDAGNEGGTTARVSSVGRLTSIFAVDIGQIANIANNTYLLVTCPLSVLIGGYLLHGLVGWSFLFGFAIIILVQPITTWISKKYSGSKRILYKARDRRVALVNEVCVAFLWFASTSLALTSRSPKQIMQGIRMIKYFAYERLFAERVQEARDTELKALLKTYVVSIGLKTLHQTSSLLVTLVTFMAYIKLVHGDLTASVAFTSILIFERLRWPLSGAPTVIITAFIDAYTSINRIEEFMCETEVCGPDHGNAYPYNADHIGFENAFIAWPKNNANNNAQVVNNGNLCVLQDLNVRLPIGEITIVSGPTGSGKSAFLLALLNEMELLQGTIVGASHADPAGKVGYVGHQAWLQSMSLRDNILFGETMDQDRYQKVLLACALLPDIRILPHGDLTQIGEKGVTLSGGQKQRVALARAVYSSSACLLLDDILSAVDAHTARHIIHHCLNGPLLKGRTVVLVTHHLQACSRAASYLIRLNGGRIQYAGDIKADSGIRLLDGDMPKDRETEEAALDEAPNLTDAKGNTTSAPTPKAETRVRGRVAGKLVLMYISSAGGILFGAALVLAFACSRLITVAEGWWLKVWSDAFVDVQFQTSANLDMQQEHEPRSSTYYLQIYIIISFAARRLHAAVLYSILHAPVDFFDRTPNGQILNRFSKDFNAIDSQLMDNFVDFLDSSLASMAIVVIVCLAAPFFWVAAMLLGTIYWRISMAFRKASRELKRLDSNSKSPIFTLASEAIPGAITIRAFQAQKRFMNEMFDATDDGLRTYYIFRGVNRWLAIRVDLIGAIVALITGLAILVYRSSIGAGLAGLSLTYALSFVNQMNWLVRSYTSIELNLNSVERVEEYIAMPQEGFTAEIHPPQSWPEQGTVAFQKVELKYRPDGESILKDISIDLQGSTKVAIVGRTGSGKSTLANCLFRMRELHSGTICIDGVDISKVALEDLRSKLSMIPQDPVLLSGTIRSNLDPGNKFSDDKLWAALRSVELHTGDQDVASTESRSSVLIRTLDDPVDEGGSNFSQGQRQLMCLARAMLRGSKILVMDEATASIDLETDAKIQHTIRKHFRGCTIFCIAHRLRTIMRYDTIMLLENGELRETGSPRKLLIEEQDSAFRQMCEASGELHVLLNIVAHGDEIYNMQ